MDTRPEHFYQSRRDGRTLGRVLARFSFVAVSLVAAVPLALAEPTPQPSVVAPPASVQRALDDRHARGWSRLPPATRTKMLAAAHKVATAVDASLSARAQLDLDASARQSLASNGIDLADMPIEDAVTMIFMLVAQDARDDLRSLLAEMDRTRQRRAALRDAVTKMKQETAAMRADAERLRAYEELIAHRIDVVNARLAKVNAALASCYRSGNGVVRCVPPQKACNCPPGDACYRNGNEPGVTHCIPGPKPCNCAPGEVCYRDGSDANATPRCVKGPAPCNCPAGDVCYRSGNDPNATPRCVPGPAACSCPPGDVCYRDGTGGAPRCVSPR